MIDTPSVPLIGPFSLPFCFSKSSSAIFRKPQNKVGEASIPSPRRNRATSAIRLAMPPISLPYEKNPRMYMRRRTAVGPCGQAHIMVQNAYWFLSNNCLEPI